MFDAGRPRTYFSKKACIALSCISILCAGPFTVHAPARIEHRMLSNVHRDGSSGHEQWLRLIPLGLMTPHGSGMVGVYTPA